MDIIKEFKKDYESKYKISDGLLQEYKKVFKEYMDLKNKYSDTLDELKGQLDELRGKVQRLTDEKIAFEKSLNFEAADLKQKEIDKMIKNVNKIVDRTKIVEDTLKNNGGEIKEKATNLMQIVSRLSVEADRKYTDAFADFHTRREEYNTKINNEIPQILSPLGDMIWECRRLHHEIKGY